MFVFLRSCGWCWFSVTFIFNFSVLSGTLHAMNLENDQEFPLGSWHVKSSSLLSRSPHSIFLAVTYSLNTFWEATEQEKQLPAKPGEIRELSLLLLKGRELGLFANDHHLVSMITFLYWAEEYSLPTGSIMSLLPFSFF